ncbi:MAG: GNAT family N-acetyltransferase [Actinomycetota bacterium]|nr:GNAT family N-acetyltransferase [Actinomycetota bacterium]
MTEPYAVDDLNEAVASRWRDLDPMLPAPRARPDGCRLVVSGANGRPAGVGFCRHWQVPDDALEQVWGTATRLELTPRLREPDTFAALDELLGQWRDHLAALPEASGEDSSAIINWPSRDISGVRALLKHGMQPIVVIGVRSAGRTVADRDLPPGVLIRPADADDLDSVTELEMGVIRFDAHFGAAIMRPATEALVRVDTLQALTRWPGWAWVAERDGRLVGLVHVQPPPESAWISCMTRPGTTAYLQTMFVGPDVRGGGLGAALVEHAHAQLDARGISTILLHYAQLNPLSAPFWNRMGYRPLWTGWETRPASALR